MCLLQGSKILVTRKNCIFEAALLLPYVVSEITWASKSDQAHCKVAQDPNALLIFLLCKEAS